MNNIKTTLISCQQCGRRIMVRAVDAGRGSITCSHTGCGAVNVLQTMIQYDEAIVEGLPDFGRLVYLNKPGLAYPLRFGPNIIGTGDSCTVRLERFEHSGRCFVSRQHCTLTVAFDKWTGRLRYHLQDGAADAEAQTVQPSRNGTLLNGVSLQKTDIIDAGDGDVITLGGADRLRLTAAPIDSAMLSTYKVDLAFNPDRTQ